MSGFPHESFAQRAFQHFRDGLAKGTWGPFLEMLSDDFEFWFPIGKFAGRHQGKPEATAFFNYVSQTFPKGLHITQNQALFNATSVAFEFEDHGELAGKPYENRVVIVLDIRDEQIVSYREYFGRMA